MWLHPHFLRGRTWQAAPEACCEGGGASVAAAGLTATPPAANPLHCPVISWSERTALGLHLPAGGISNGEHIVLRVAFKPTSTISREQKTVSRAGEDVALRAKGRHDPCVVPRAVPMVEAMVALVLVDHLLMVRCLCPFVRHEPWCALSWRQPAGCHATSVFAIYIWGTRVLAAWSEAMTQD